MKYVVFHNEEFQLRDSQETAEHQTVQLSELEEIPVMALFYETLPEDDETIAKAQKRTSFPWCQRSLIELDASSAEQEILIQRERDRWIMLNTLSITENIFTICQHLKKIWPNQRIEFFEEFWFLIQSLLGTQELRIIFNDAETKNEKNISLVHTALFGRNIPQISKGKDSDKVVLDEFQKFYSLNTPQVQEWNEQSKQLVITAGIDKGPVLIMAQTEKFSPLQLAILKAIFSGLQN